ncbi:hypothetical protein BELL_0299g00030 [Botrytis elliptica]|uniref:Uncharacterized protein n=1 Tax=Botrytis elliptica TaxID=278938 RepID=A0A4Z1JSN5_9HELO|nr:hypothetical protein BELL_0299g00030 [Botrytis elliptica]
MGEEKRRKNPKPKPKIEQEKPGNRWNTQCDDGWEAVKSRRGEFKNEVKAGRQSQRIMRYRGSVPVSQYGGAYIDDYDYDYP